MKNLNRYVVVLTLLAISGSVLAATGANTADFVSLVQLLVNWATGSLGKVIATGMFVIGLAIGISKQSLMSIIAGTGCAFGLVYGPVVINGMFTAVV